MISTVLDMGKRVVVLGDPPELGFKPRSKYARDLMLGRFDEENYNIFVNEPLNQILADYISTLANDQVNYVNVLDELCPNQKCRLINNNKMLYTDGDHLSIYGAQELSPLLVQILALRAITN
jgi:lysophospholipase L1-like esterase